MTDPLAVALDRRFETQHLPYSRVLLHYVQQDITTEHTVTESDPDMLSRGVHFTHEIFCKYITDEASARRAARYLLDQQRRLLGMEPRKES